MLILSRADLERVLTPREVIDALESAFALSAAGRARVPPRTALTVEPDGVLLVMPAALHHESAGNPDLGSKLVSVYPGNRARGQPIPCWRSPSTKDATGRCAGCARRSGSEC